MGNETETQQSKSDKMNRAMTRARGGESVEIVETKVNAPVLVPTGFEGLVGRAAPQEVIADIVDRGWENSPQLFTIEEGCFIEGILEGNGIPAEFTDSRTGDVREVPTWIIRALNTSARVSILSSAQLDRKLPLVPLGGPVKIYRVGKTKLSNAPGYVTEYIVTAPKLRAFTLALPAGAAS